MAMLCSMSVPLFGQATVAGAGHEVLESQSARYRASVDRDLKALDLLIADEMAYGHSNGSVDPKAAYVTAVESGRYRNFVPSAMKVDVYGDAAVATGRLAVTAAAVGQEATVIFRIIDVYVKRAGRWQLAHTQSTRIDPPPK